MSFSANNITENNIDDFVIVTDIETVPADGLRDVTGNTRLTYEDAGNLLIAKLMAVPVPPAIGLFGAGLTGLTGLVRRKSA